MVVFNTNPEGSAPIKLTVKTTENPDTGYETFYSIKPGQGMDLTLVGLLTKQERRYECLKRKLVGQKAPRTPPKVTKMALQRKT